MERLVAGQGELRAFVASLLPYNPSDAMDVVSETNRVLIEHASDYDVSRQFRPWMFTFARNQVLAFRKKCSRSRLVFDEDLAQSAAESYDRQFPEDDSESRLLAALETCKNRLPPQHRDLIDRRYTKKQSVNDIARERQANPHTVTTLLAYIRDRLAACIHSVCNLSSMDSAPASVPSETQRAGAILEGLAVESENFLGDLRASPRLLDEWVLQRRLDSLLELDASLGSTVRPAAVSRPRFPVARPSFARLAALLALCFGIVALASVTTVALVRRAAAAAQERAIAATIRELAVEDLPEEPEASSNVTEMAGAGSAAVESAAASTNESAAAAETSAAAPTNVITSAASVPSTVSVAVLATEPATVSWTGAGDGTTWSDGNNWSGGVPPAATDTAVFNAAAAVSLSAPVAVSNLQLGAALTLSGGGTNGLTVGVVSGTGRIILQGAGLRNVAGSALTFTNDVELSGSATNWFSSNKGANIEYYGRLSGAGTVEFRSTGKGTSGVKLHGDNSCFTGTALYSNNDSGSRNSFQFMNGDAASSNAHWNISTPSDYAYPIFAIGSVTYRLGDFNGYAYLAYSSTALYDITLEVGARGGESAVSANFISASRRDILRKVGSGTLVFTGSNLATLEIAGGTVALGGASLPASIAFTGSGATLCMTNGVVLDPSAVIQNSTAPVAFDDGGSNYTWASSLKTSNIGGFIKKGGGVLTLAAKPYHYGPTVIEAGQLAVPVGTAFETLAISDGALLVFNADADSWTNGATLVLCTFTNLAATVLSGANVLVEGLNDRSGVTLTFTSTSVVAAVSAETLVWKGADDEGWTDVGRWIGDLNGQALTFAPGDRVLFSDAGFEQGFAATNRVRISGVVAPASVDVDVSAGYGYRLAGGGVTCAGSFEKSGAGSVFLSNIVVACGGVSVANGELVLESDALAAPVMNASVLRVAAPGSPVRLGSVSGAGTTHVDSGSVVFTGGVYQTTFLATNVAATILQDGTMGDDAKFRGGGLLDFTNVTFDASGSYGNTTFGTGFTGTLRVSSGATLRPTRNNDQFYQFGTGTLSLAGGVIGSLATSGVTSERKIKTPRIELVPGTTSVWSDAAARIILQGALSGSGTLNASTARCGFQLSGDNADFSGTFNFNGSGTGDSVDAGFQSVIAGSSNACWNLNTAEQKPDGLGVPCSFVLFSKTFATPLRLGAFNVLKPAATVSVWNPGYPLEIGGRNEDCAIEGGFVSNTVSLVKVGSARLSLGTNFTCVAGSAFAVSNGMLEVNARAAVPGTFTVASGAVLSGIFTASNIVFAAGASVSNELSTTSAIRSMTPVDISGLTVRIDPAQLEKGNVYSVLTAPAMVGKAALDPAPDHWVTGRLVNADGTQTLTIRRATGFYVIICSL